MATVTKGRTFVSGETVTPAKLNELVDNATVTAIQTADISDSQITTAKIADLNVTAAKLASTLDLSGKSVTLADNSIALAKLVAAVQSALVPAGAILPFAFNSVPTGWLLADGTAVLRANFPALFTAIGTTFGAGDGSTTFNLPDLRGIFIRGAASQTISGTTYSGTFAQKQQDAFKSHTHQARWLLTDAGVGVGVGGWGSATAYSNNFSQIEPTGGTETRPANMALTYCIKF